MTRPVLSEWNGPELIYVEPTQVVKSFGYVSARPRLADTWDHLQSTLDRVADADGEPAPERLEYPDPTTASAAIKDVARELGAHMAGITHVDRRHVYKGEEVPHRFAIVVAVPMNYDHIKRSPSIDSSYEVLRVYDEIGRIATELGKHIRGRGYPARAHTLRFEQINMLPHAYAAGLGELGKHGSLINRELGCCFRVAVVTTDLPLAEDAPKLEGIDAVCANCRMCVDFCPADAIDDEKQEVRGFTKWVVDTEACAPYWASYYACGICLQVCPFNAKSLGGKFKNTFVETIKGIDLPKWRADLKESLQEPWSDVVRPSEFPEDWRMRVRGKSEADPLKDTG